MPGTRNQPPSFSSRRCVVAVIGSALATAWLAVIPSAEACRFNIREIGFVDENQPRFELSVFVHGDEQAAWLPEFQSTAQSVLGRSNVVWSVVDEVSNPSAPELRFRAQLGPRLPSAIMHMAGRDDGWPVALHATGDDLAARLKGLVASASRAQLTAALIDTYGAVMLLRGTDATANAAAREAIQAAIKETETALADLPKRISLGPRFVEVDPTLPDEQIVAWSLGVDGKDLTLPVAAVLYGRGRLAGPALRGATLTAAKLREQLSIVGADCECTMDHSWMTAGSIPIVFSPSDEARLTHALGFNPASPAIRAEVSQILATQARIAADPSAPRAAGYRETPIEVITLSPASTALPVAARRNVPWGIVAAVAGGLLAVGIVWQIASRKRG